MRKKCKNVKALFGLWPAEPCAACIVLFPELEWATVDISDVSRSAGRPPPPTPSAGMQAVSRLMLWLTAAVMQPSLQKGASSPTHQLTHFSGKLLPNSQSSQSAGLGLEVCHDCVALTVVNGITNHKCMFVVLSSALVWMFLEGSTFQSVNLQGNLSIYLSLSPSLYLSRHEHVILVFLLLKTPLIHRF